MKTLSPGECSKAFWYGVLSVLSFGAVPSYLHRLPEIKIKDAGTPNTNIGSIEDDFRNISGDIRRGFRLVSTESGNTVGKKS